MAEMKSEAVIKAELVAALASLGVQAGDTLMLHASMRTVGCRAETLLDALQEAVTPTGRLLSLICAEEGKPFDPDRSSAWSELGVLAEVFRTRPGVVLNRHPMARMGAWGADAGGLVEDPPLHDYYGPGSPLQRLVDGGGKVLRLGADRDTATVLHFAEYLADLPNKRRVTHVVDVCGAGRLDIRCLDDSNGIRDLPGEDYFARILDAALLAGLARVGPVGGATAELVDANALVRFGVRWLEANDVV